MIIQGTSKQIQITSDIITEVITNPFDFEKIDITVKRNCCTEEFTDTVDITLEKKFNVKIYKPNNEVYSYVKAVYFKNFDNNETFKIELPSSLLIQDCSDLNELSLLINEYITNNFPESVIDPDGSDSDSSTSSELDTGTIKTICDSSSDPISFIYTIWNLPENIIPIYIDFDYDNVPIMEQFYYNSSDKNSIISVTRLILNPDILALEYFPDSVYTIFLKFTKLSGTQITQSNCTFVDCTMKCKVIEKLKELNEKDQIELLMIHYGLSIGSNCSCECEELCTLFKKLAIWLDEEIQTNCDCEN